MKSLRELYKSNKTQINKVHKEGYKRKRQVIGLLPWGNKKKRTGMIEMLRSRIEIKEQTREEYEGSPFNTTMNNQGKLAKKDGNHYF